MASLVKLNAQLHLAQLAFSKNPSEGNQAKIDELLAQISEVAVIADDSTQSQQTQTAGSTEEKKNEVKAPAKPQTPKAPAAPKAKAPAKPKAPESPKAPAKNQPVQTPLVTAPSQEELTKLSLISQESTEKQDPEVTDSQTPLVQNEQNS
ncbi:hypothetical protein [Siphonobacter sp. SORGH_AS_0500]|uniref:hypothetical protein n=1 Tax=Siphonobacter sp. SORGH_AS_0500 TaxID=1864824 RepID=UPI00285C20FF|nr:hypothetical protein [Siphonobacter sp. SORGH_AS_0500]MDR6195622.1 pyruvate/2-oxoglutarate dehydrogenase complex dihydrolipoamide acyltransferase (E2) component [Siphonobacter sp. SORGH_AS_0500]